MLLLCEASLCLPSLAWPHLASRFLHCNGKYTWPGSNWRPSACEADVIATRPQVLLLHTSKAHRPLASRMTTAAAKNLKGFAMSEQMLQ